MQYEGGLDRKAATLAAFALYFPADCRAMKEAAAGLPDGEAALYEYLEGLIKAPRTHENGPPLDEDAKNMENKYIYNTSGPQTIHLYPAMKVYRDLNIWPPITSPL